MWRIWRFWFEVLRGVAVFVLNADGLLRVSLVPPTPPITSPVLFLLDLFSLLSIWELVQQIVVFPFFSINFPTLL